MASKVLSTATTRAAISMHGSQSRTEAETAAFGYPARALVFKQRVRKSDLWLSATCAVVTASDGLALPSRGGGFSFPSLYGKEEGVFWKPRTPPHPTPAGG